MTGSVGGYESPENAQTLLDKKGAVCRVILLSETQNDRQDCGTGFLVGPGLVMTNNHVLPEKTVWKNARAIFYYGTKNQLQLSFDPETFFFPSPSPDKKGILPLELQKLDFTIVALSDPDKKLDTINQLALNIFSPESPRKHMPANIIHYPFENNKQTGGLTDELKLSFQGNTVTQVDRRHKQPKSFTVTIGNKKWERWQSRYSIHYTSKTNFGSSGGPVMDNGANLIALHRAKCLEHENCNQGINILWIRNQLSLDSEKYNKFISFHSPQKPISSDSLHSKLRNRYAQNDITCLSEFIPSSEPTSISDYFTKLSIVPRDEQQKREKQSNDFTTPKKDSLRQIHDQMQKAQGNLEIHKLFSKSPKVLVIGRAGIGKSALCQKTAYEWGQGNLWKQSFEFTYLLKLRDFEESFLTESKKLSTNEWLSKALAKYCLQQESQPAILSQLAQKKGSTLLVLDGYDEASLELKKRLLPIFQDPQLHILLTSRPEAAFSLHKIFKTQVENIGFSNTQIKTYIDNFFKDEKLAAIFHTYLKSKQNHFAIAHIPLQLEILCNLWEEGKTEFPETLTQMMERMVSKLHEWQCKRDKDKDGNEIDPDNISQDEKDIIHTILGKIALNGLKKNKLLIDKKAYDESLRGTNRTIKHLKKTGLLKFTENNDKIYFLHLTYQEYMTALMVKRQSLKSQKTFVLTHINQPQFRLVIQMLAHLIGKPVFDWIYTADLEPQKKLQLMLGCLSECPSQGSIWKDKGIVEQVKTLDKAGQIILWAASKNLFSVVKWLASSCEVDVNAKDGRGQTALHLAASSCSLEAVKCLIADCRADVKAKDKADDTALHYAARHGRVDLVKYLVTDCGANVNAKDKLGDTALHHAAVSRSLEVVEYLVDRGANVNAIDVDGITALHVAVDSGSLEVVKYLVSEGEADVKAKDKGGGTALLWAARSGSLKIVKCLVSEGEVDVKAKTKNGETALHIAAQSGRVEVVKYLVDCGADVNATDKDSMTVLHHAAISRSLEVVEYLVDVGANVSAKDKGGGTALHWAAKSGSLEVVEYLVSKDKAGVKAKDKGGITALHWAAISGSLKVVKCLVSKDKAGVNAIDEDGITVLHCAVRSCSLEVVKYLVDCGASVNAKDKGGITALHVAVDSGSLEVVKCLVTDGRANVNAKDKRGQTALHWAAISGSLEVVKCLVTDGKADVSARNKGGLTALRWAAQLGYDEMVSFLESNLFSKK